MKKLVKWAYKKFVNEIYLPSGTDVYIERYPRVFKESYGHIKSVRLTHTHQEEYVFNYLGETHLFESTTGITYTPITYTPYQNEKD